MGIMAVAIKVFVNRLFFITATGGPYSDPALPPTKLEIRP